MKLPVDVSALMKEAVNIDKARQTQLSVCVYMSLDAPAELSAFARSVFATNAPQVRLTLSYLDTFDTATLKDVDFAVIVAGASDVSGLAAAAIREAGVPVFVLAPTEFLSEGKAAVPLGDTIRVFDFDEESFAKAKLRMGEWIAEVCEEKRLALALAFPFVARPLALEAVRATSVQNAGIGVVTILPGADFPIMTLNQGKMLLQIAAAYGQPMTKERATELAAAVAGGFACRAVARNVVGIVPVLGWAIKGGIGFAGTYAMGMAAIEYFEAGGGVSGLNQAVGHIAQRAGALAQQIQQQAQRSAWPHKRS